MKKPNNLEEIYPVKSFNDLYQVYNNINHFLAQSHAKNKVEVALARYVKATEELHRFSVETIKNSRPPKN